MRKRFWLVGISVLACALALGEDYRGLLGQPTRPTVAEFKAAVPRLPANNPFPRAIAANPAYLANLRHYAPKAIATFEKSFPGAHWVFIGRDSSWLCNVFQAFYDAIGEPDRVTCLPLSRASLNGNMNDLLEFARGYGLTADGAIQQRPIVLIDRTTYNQGSSQVRLLLQAMYQDYAGRHGDAGPLLGRLFAISIGHNMANPLESTNLEQLYARLRGRPMTREPSEIVSYNVGQVGANNLNQNTEWHDAFQRFTRQGNRVVSQPGALFAEKNRNQILSELYEIVRTVQAPEFVRLVSDASARIGGDWRPQIADHRDPAPVRQPPPEPPAVRPPAPPAGIGYVSREAEDLLRLARRGDEPARRDARAQLIRNLTDVNYRASLIAEMADSKRLAHVFEEMAAELPAEVLRDYVAALDRLPAREDTHERARQACSRILAGGRR